MAKTTSRKSAKAAKKDAVKRGAAKSTKSRKPVAKSSARKPKAAQLGRKTMTMEDSSVAGVIAYLNTDLDLVSTDDLVALAAAFTTGGAPPLRVLRGTDGLSYATFETEEQHSEPDRNIAAMLDVVESLDPPLRSAWESCSQREFNIGYDCGLEPWAFNQGLSARTLGRMSTAGASLRITLYPNRGR